MTLDDLMEIANYEIIEMALKYEVKFSDYEITEKEFYDYCEQLNSYEPQYWELKRKIADDSTRLLLFYIVVPSIIFIVIDSWLPRNIHPFAFLILFIPSLVAMHRYLYPLFDEWYCKKRKERFLEKNNVKRNFNVERFINEVMFQAYMRNRNPIIESKVKIIKR